MLVKRGGFGKHKPQVWSGPSPCYDKNGVMKFVSLVTNKKLNEGLLSKFGVKCNRFCKVKKISFKFSTLRRGEEVFQFSQVHRKKNVYHHLNPFLNVISR